MKLLVVCTLLSCMLDGTMAQGGGGAGASRAPLLAASVHQAALFTPLVPSSTDGRPAPIGSLTVFSSRPLPEMPLERHYAGFLNAPACNDPNGCDWTVLLHESAVSCDSTQVMQGATPAQVAASNDTTPVRLQGMLEVAASSSLNEAVLVVESTTTGPIACGLLQLVPEEAVLETITLALGQSGVVGSAVVVKDPVVDTGVCFLGRAVGLEANVNSFLQSDATANYTQCTAANGCGVHVHSGTACTNSTTQMGHYYNREILPEDPWALVGYLQTDETGAALFVDCVETGFQEYAGKAFVVHAEDGSRVACGILESSTSEPPQPPPPPSTSNLEVDDGASHPVFQATLESTVDGGNVEGMVTVFQVSDSTVAFSGTATGLPANLNGDACSGRGGCAFRIQDATSCEAAEDGQSYFDSDKVANPWRRLQYETNADGLATFSAMLNVGTAEIEGLVFILRGPDGAVVACGSLAPVMNTLSTTTAELSSSGVTSHVTAAVSPTDDTTVCLFASATGLEPSLNSFLVGGPDCTATNGCGLHIHSGTDCTDKDSQGGHYYGGAVTDDPWRIVGYTTTTEDEGVAYFVDCVTSGETVFEGQAFLVHANDGSRVSCGLLDSDVEEAPEPNEDSGPSAAPHALVLLWSSLVAAVVFVQVWWV